jgi:hypothetical protein
MDYSKIIVAYQPAIPASLRSHIKDNYSPSMTDEEWDTAQYQLDYIIDDLNCDAKMKSFVKILQRLVDDGVSYIEL